MSDEFPVKVRLLVMDGGQEKKKARDAVRYHSSFGTLPLRVVPNLFSVPGMAFYVTEDAALRLIDLEAVELV